MKSMDRRAKNGVTLIEVMLAGAILSLAILTLFEGIGVCTRVAHENAQFLVADAYAHDLAWKRFNEDYVSLKTLLTNRRGQAITENISSNAAPALWIRGAQAISRTTLSYPRTGTDGAEDQSCVAITVDVEWGPAGNRHSLSASGHTVGILKSGAGEEDG